MKLNESDNKNINVICIELNEYLINRFKYKTLPAYRTLNRDTNIITCRRVKFDVSIRLIKLCRLINSSITLPPKS